MIKITNLTFHYKEKDSFIFDNAILRIDGGLWLLDGEVMLKIHRKLLIKIFMFFVLLGIVMAGIYYMQK